jgi:hypothetical protein
MGKKAWLPQNHSTQAKEVIGMEDELDEERRLAGNNGKSIRMTRRQVEALAKAVLNTNTEAVQLSLGEDGRLIVKAVETVEKLRALKIS